LMGEAGGGDDRTMKFSDDLICGNLSVKLRKVCQSRELCEAEAKLQFIRELGGESFVV
jgi:hypothetical protein